MRSNAGLAGAGAVLAVAVLLGVSYKKHRKFPPHHESGQPYDHSMLTCQTRPQDGKKVCELKIENLISAGKGHPCVFDPEDPHHKVKEPPYTHHDKFAIYIADGYALKISGGTTHHTLVRFRDFISLPNTHHPTGCARPFTPALTTNNFGEDETGPPNTSTAECVYELAVQSNEEDPSDPVNHPDDPNDPGHHYFCIDPHFEMVAGTGQLERNGVAGQGR